MGISIGYSGRNHRKTESQSAAAHMGAALRVRNKGRGAYRRRGVVTPPYGGQEVPTAGRRGRRPLRSVTRNAARDRWDDGGIVPYGVGKTPVWRGQCAPPLGVQYVSAAAHMGAALRVRNKGRGAYRRRGVVTPPYGGQEVPTAGRRGRRPLRSVTRNAARDRRDDVGIVRYGVDKTPVGRGQCAPPPTKNGLPACAVSPFGFSLKLAFH